MSSLKNINYIFSINSVGYAFDRKLKLNFAFDGEAHSFWELVYVADGNIVVTENDNVYHMGEGDIIFHAPMEFHRIWAANNTTPHVFNLSFTTTGEVPPKITEGIFRLKNEEEITFTKLFNYIEKEFLGQEHPDPFVGLEISSRMSSFILSLVKTTPSKDALSTSQSAITYKSVVRLMNDEVYSDLNIDDIAKKCYISVSYIKSLFSKYAGMSPKKYYAGLRTETAKYHLLKGMSVKAVSEQMNFSSVNHFIRFFKSHTGYTPLQYKNNIPL